MLKILSILLRKITKLLLFLLFLFVLDNLWRLNYLLGFFFFTFDHLWFISSFLVLFRSLYAMRNDFSLNFFFFFLSAFRFCLLSLGKKLFLVFYFFFKLLNLNFLFILFVFWLLRLDYKFLWCLLNWIWGVILLLWVFNFMQNDIGIRHGLSLW